MMGMGVWHERERWGRVIRGWNPDNYCGNHGQVPASPRVILEVIHAGVVWVWER